MEISDQQIIKAFEGTKFGPMDGNVILQRKYIAQAVMKIACKYTTGHTMKMILIELGLISGKTLKPSKPALRWMYDVYNKSN